MPVLLLYTKLVRRIKNTADASKVMVFWWCYIDYEIYIGVFTLYTGVNPIELP